MAAREGDRMVRFDNLDHSVRLLTTVENDVVANICLNIDLFMVKDPAENRRELSVTTWGCDVVAKIPP